MALRLTKEVLEMIQAKSIELYSPLSQALDISVGSLKMYISRNSRRLTEYAPLKVLSDYTGKPVQQLIEEYDEDEDRVTGNSGDTGSGNSKDEMVETNNKLTKNKVAAG